MIRWASDGGRQCPYGTDIAGEIWFCALQDDHGGGHSLAHLEYQRTPDRIRREAAAYDSKQWAPVADLRRAAKWKP